MEFVALTDFQRVVGPYISTSLLILFIRVTAVEKDESAVDRFGTVFADLVGRARGLQGAGSYII